jgi:hypothetical protein
LFPFSPFLPLVPLAPPPPPPPPQFWTLVNENDSLPVSDLPKFIPTSPTAPPPLPCVCSMNGSIAVAVVLLVTFAVVNKTGNFCAPGSFHSTSAVDPVKPVPVNVTSVPGHPPSGDTDVSFGAADAAWALPSSTSMAVLASRLSRPNPRLRARAASWVPCLASLR